MEKLFKYLGTAVAASAAAGAFAQEPRGGIADPSGYPPAMDMNSQNAAAMPVEPFEFRPVDAQAAEGMRRNGAFPGGPQNVMVFRGRPDAADAAQGQQQVQNAQGAQVVSQSAQAPASGDASAASAAASSGGQEGGGEVPSQSAYVSVARLSDDGSDESMLAALSFNNPFGNAKKPDESEMGISLKSIAMIDGRWNFSVASKEGKTAWLGIDEQSEVVPCKILSFDEPKMTVKALVGGRVFDLMLAEGTSARKVELDPRMMGGPPRRMSPQEREKLWSAATDDQKRRANEIMARARASGRRPDFRQMMRLENEVRETVRQRERQAQQGAAQGR